VYDLRTNIHFTLKTNPLRRELLDDFVRCYFNLDQTEAESFRKQENPKRPSVQTRITREPTWSPDNPDGRWRCFEYEELIKRDKVNLDIFWLRDKSLEDADNLPEPDELAREIADDLQTAFEQFNSIAAELGA
jgi:type I restriction enzyme M protein